VLPDAQPRCSPVQRFQGIFTCCDFLNFSIGIWSKGAQSVDSSDNLANEAFVHHRRLGVVLGGSPLFEEVVGDIFEVVFLVGLRPSGWLLKERKKRRRISYRIDRKLPLEIGEVLPQTVDGLPKIRPVVLEKRPKFGLQLKILPAGITLHE